MTYEELLETINSSNFMESRTLESPYKVLRAVVELHKRNSSGCCSACGLPPTSTIVIYPCKTIQAIEKELQ